MHDALTGLPNRRAFTQATAKAVAAWTPVNDRTSWILSIDLDYFKEVNDRYGHQAGDAFLVAASQRLFGATPMGDLVARVGGDEFAVLVHHYDPDSSHAQSVGEAICEAFADPIVVEGVEHRLAASIGIVAVDALHETVDSLLRDADIAMYRAKEDGGDRAVMFDDVLRQEIVDRAEIASDLRAALAREVGPRVVFQPILALDDRTCYGFEALVRWNHPTRGEIPAGLLIDIAQETRLIVPLGRRVIHEVCRHLAQWRSDGLALETLSVHINVSPMEAGHVATYASIADAMETWSIPAQTLVIELTETASMDSIDQAGQFLSRLHELGVRVCLDDFGTGYSSLQHLNDFQVDVIKVESLVRRFGGDRSGKNSDRCRHHRARARAQRIGDHRRYRDDRTARTHRRSRLQSRARLSVRTADAARRCIPLRAAHDRADRPYLTPDVRGLRTAARPARGIHPRHDDRVDCDRSALLCDRLGHQGAHRHAARCHHAAPSTAHSLTFARDRADTVDRLDVTHDGITIMRMQRRT